MTKYTIAIVTALFLVTVGIQQYTIHSLQEINQLTTDTIRKQMEALKSSDAAIKSQGEALNLCMDSLRRAAGR